MNPVNGPEPLRRNDTTNYGPNRRNLGHARGIAYCTAMADVYEACASVLKPGGFLVSVTKDMRSTGGGALRNLSGETIALCQDAGLLYWQRVIGLLATVRDSELVMRPSFWQTLHARRRRAKTIGRKSSRTRTCSCSASQTGHQYAQRARTVPGRRRDEGENKRNGRRGLRFRSAARHALSGP